MMEQSQQQQQVGLQSMGHPGYMAPPGHYPMQPPPPFGQALASLPTPGLAFFSPWEPPPHVTPPPSDADLQKRIDKLVEYAVKNGPQFEALMKEKQKSNPAYAFLSGGEGHEYYRYRLWSAVTPMPAAGMPNVPPPLQPQQTFGGGGLGSQSDPAFGSGLPFYDSQVGVPAPLPAVPFLAPYSTATVGGADQFRYHSAPPRPFGVDVSGGGAGAPFGGALPPDVSAELTQMLESLTGTKEVIKNAKGWFMQRAVYSQALVEALKNRVKLLSGDPERQLHIIYLINDILFNSLQHRSAPTELDQVALAFRPALGVILATIYHGANNSDANQDRLRKILDFWGAKEVYDNDTINQLEGEMMAGPPPSELTTSIGPPAAPGLFFPARWPAPEQQALAQVPFLAAGPFPPASAPGLFPSGPGPAQFQPASVQPAQQEPGPPEQPPYPLFPPGLIPGMVRKMQIGSGVPYASISPADIPTQIPPQTVSESYILKRIKKYFKAIGEVDPLEGQVDVPEDDDDREGEGIGLGGARIPPPAVMEVDPETGTLPDGSVASRGGLGSSGRAGLGAHDPEEESQYDDVYSSYRKSRSSNYHTSLSVRAAMKYEHA